MTEMGFFVLGFTMSLAILVVADAVQTAVAEAKGISLELFFV